MTVGKAGRNEYSGGEISPCAEMSPLPTRYAHSPNSWSNHLKVC